MPSSTNLIRLASQVKKSIIGGKSKLHQIIKNKKKNY